MPPPTNSTSEVDSSLPSGLTNSTNIIDSHHCVGWLRKSCTGGKRIGWTHSGMMSGVVLLVSKTRRRVCCHAALKSEIHDIDKWTVAEACILCSNLRPESIYSMFYTLFACTYSASECSFQNWTQSLMYGLVAITLTARQLAVLSMPCNQGITLQPFASLCLQPQLCQHVLKDIMLVGFNNTFKLYFVLSGCLACICNSCSNSCVISLRWVWTWPEIKMAFISTSKQLCACLKTGYIVCIYNVHLSEVVC